MTQTPPPCAHRPLPVDPPSGVVSLMSNVTVERWRRGQDLWAPDTPLCRTAFLILGHVTVMRRNWNGHWTPQFCVNAPADVIGAPVLLAADMAAGTRCVADVDVTAIMVGQLDVDGLLNASRTFRAFVYQAYATRLIGLLDDLAGGLTRNPRH